MCVCYFPMSILEPTKKTQISLCVHKFPCVFLQNWQKNMNFPVCSWIFLWVFTQSTKKIFISLFVHNFLWEFSHNRQARVNFPVCLIISCESFGNRQGNVNFPVSCWKNTQGNSAHWEKIVFSSGYFLTSLLDFVFLAAPSGNVCGMS